MSPAASAPPEARGLSRDGVRLLAATPDGLVHTVFADLPRFLSPGDLLVVNTSATIAAAVDGERAGGRPVTAHFSTPLGDGTWLVELRLPAPGSGQVRDGAAGETITLPGGAALTLLRPHPGPQAQRMWAASVDGAGEVAGFLSRHGQPVRYAYVPEPWPLSAYQSVFARSPGSAEMPSAGRPFTPALVTELVSRGVILAPVTLHAGVASLEAGEPPLPERFAVPGPTAELVNLTRAAGRRVVAVGTSCTRALESAVGPDGSARPRAGWTDLVLGADRPARVVDGLITGWHDPEASHLALLEAVAGPRLVRAAYAAAEQAGYLWHEFGDSCLLLPPRPAAARPAPPRRTGPGHGHDVGGDRAA